MIHERRQIQVLLLLLLATLAGCGGETPANEEASKAPVTQEIEANVTAARQVPEPVKIDSLPGPGATPAPPKIQADAENEADAMISQATALRTAPDLAADVIRMLPAATPVLVSERRGGWYLVRAGADEGWVRLMHLTRSGTSSLPGAGVAGEIAAIATGRAGTGNIASTTGIRGLTAEDLKLASPDTVALARLDQYGVSRSAAAADAAARGLNARRIAYLPEPAQ